MTLLKRAGAAVLVAALSVTISAGALEPPGAPAPTPGPEARIAVNSQNTPGDETAFFRITAPGSYYLTRNLINPTLISTRHGIVIEASDVTLDLNGFVLDGSSSLIIPFADPPAPQGADFPISGILASGEPENITLCNGTVRDWPGSGIYLFFVNHARIEDITAIGNGEHGIRASTFSVVRGCHARENGGFGILALSASVIDRCIAIQNGDDGIRGTGGSLVFDCTAMGNAGFGIRGDGTISNCYARGNGEGGLIGASIARHSVAEMNEGPGINLISAALALQNVSRANTVGIKIVGLQTRVEGNVLIGNDFGVETVTGSNFIVGNRAWGDTQNHYGGITGGNAVGTIQTSPVGAGPWDNFEP